MKTLRGTAEERQASLCRGRNSIPAHSARKVRSASAAVPGCLSVVSRLHLKCDGTRRRTGG